MLALRTLQLATALFSVLTACQAFAYEKATEGKEVVLNKMYPREGKIELDAKFGFVLNSSYTQTMLAGASINYFFNEIWGFNVEANMAITSGKSERECIESFYNDPKYEVGPECAGLPEPTTADVDGTKANFGPAYVPVRELNLIAGANVLWNPLYGKQIILLSGVGHFDLFIAMGGGIATSTFYPLQKELRLSGKTSRGNFPEDGSNEPTPGTLDVGEVGLAGRPDPVAQTNVVAHFAVGQRFHFAKRFAILAELNNYTLLGTEQGFDNFFALMGGLAIRF